MRNPGQLETSLLNGPSPFPVVMIVCLTLRSKVEDTLMSGLSTKSSYSMVAVQCPAATCNMRKSIRLDISQPAFAKISSLIKSWRVEMKTERSLQKNRRSTSPFPSSRARRGGLLIRKVSSCLLQNSANFIILSRKSSDESKLEGRERGLSHNHSLSSIYIHSVVLLISLASLP